MTRREYPRAERLDLVEDLHGHKVADPYRWLEDPADPRTAAWLGDQDALFRAEREGWPGRERFEARLAALMATGSVSTPVWRGGRAFFSRRAADQEHAVLLTVDPDGTERVLLDPVALDPSGLTTLDTWVPAPSGRLVAYQVSTGGVEESDVYVLDVEDGRVVDGPVDRTRFSAIAWLPDDSGFYYSRRLAPELVPENERQYHRRVWLHRLGADPADDVVVFGEGQPMTSIFRVGLSRDGRWLDIAAGSGTDPRNDLFVADLSTGPLEAPLFTPVQVGVDAQTHLSHARPGSPLAGRVYIYTDRDAPRRRLCVASPDDLAYESWRDLIPEAPDAVFEDYTVLDGDGLERPLLLALWSRHAVSEITVHDLQTGERLDEVRLPGLGTVEELTSHRDGGAEAWFSYADFGTPAQVYRYDAVSGQVTLWAAAPGGVEAPAVRTRRLVYRSADGTGVGVFVLDDGVADGPRPTILYGYGGFNIALTPDFSARTLAWIGAGGRYAVANLRGGSEEGEAWHRAGMLANKQNVFDDFHAAADFLVAEGLTTPDRLGIMGGSNGGLLVGAALTQHPEKYAAVVCSAPLLDMVRYERFGLGEFWNGEYGTAEDPEQFGWLLAYSPYHNVRGENVHGENVRGENGANGSAGPNGSAGSNGSTGPNGADSAATQYPATLFTVFGGDTRVDPLHARKLAAALQHATTGERPILFRNEGGVGHGARAVSRTVGLSADELSFFAARLGLDVGAAADATAGNQAREANAES